MLKSFRLENYLIALLHFVRPKQICFRKYILLLVLLNFENFSTDISKCIINIPYDNNDNNNITAVKCTHKTCNLSNSGINKQTNRTREMANKHCAVKDKFVK